MPLIQYKCPKCGSVQELLQKSSDSCRPTCTHCDAKMDKMLSTFSCVSAPDSSQSTGGCGCGCQNTACPMAQQ